MYQTIYLDEPRSRLLTVFLCVRQQVVCANCKLIRFNAMCMIHMDA